jgi:hypothetical protein
MLAPISIADKNRGPGPFFRVAHAEIPPEDRLNSEDLEKVGGDVRDRRAGGLRSTRNGRGVITVLRDRLKAAVLIAKIVEVGSATRDQRPFELTSKTAMIRFESVHGSGRSNTPYTTLKIAVVAPIANARVKTMTVVAPGFFRSWRRP